MSFGVVSCIVKNRVIFRCEMVPLRVVRYCVVSSGVWCVVTRGDPT